MVQHATSPGLGKRDASWRDHAALMDRCRWPGGAHSHWWSSQSIVQLRTVSAGAPPVIRGRQVDVLQHSIQVRCTLLHACCQQTCMLHGCDLRQQTYETRTRIMTRPSPMQLQRRRLRVQPHRRILAAPAASTVELAATPTSRPGRADPDVERSSSLSAESPRRSGSGGRCSGGGCRIGGTGREQWKCACRPQ